MAFSDQIKSLTGIDISNSTIDGYLNQWMTDGVKEIINILPDRLLSECIEVSTLNNSLSTFSLSAVTTGKVMSVSRSDGIHNQVCRRISLVNASRAEDPSDIMNFSSKTDPVYYIKSRTLHVYPTPTASETAEVAYIYLRVVNADTDTVILNFPSEAEYLVVNYASIKSLNYLMNQISGDELDLVTDFADANNWLNTEEDNEMVSSRLAVIGAQLNDFTIKRRDQDQIYKWYKDQYELLKTDYAMGIRALEQGTMERVAQQGAKR